MIDFIPVLIYFFAVIDPIGTLPVFIAATKQHTVKQRRFIALMAFLTSSIILLFFIVAGEIILTAMHIPLAAFQVAGGIVLFLFALTMIFGESKPEQEIKMAATIRETAVFPIAVPSIASPGAMLAAVLLTKNNVYTLWEQAQTAAMMMIVLLITLVLMLTSTVIMRLIGSAGASIISRVMGFILASLATTNILAGISDYFGLSVAAVS
ncbi:MAG: MarC family protein [Pseudomonadota bacterium]|nr:MarC family protein [Alteromonas sp.]MDY6929475.1 MarC family protein [Pseudomonadota bacterium]RPH16003.1 MAG: MarC family protein [Alteromonadaceae bacterium TMED7]|tara:strand:- start:1292 stop:1918 length:627 start_codon:yes stop_codon:yes gene_type:complete